MTATTPALIADHAFVPNPLHTQNACKVCKCGARIHAASTPEGLREYLARQIARAEGFAIVGPSADWTRFALDDAQTVARTVGQWPNIQTVGEKVIRTWFTWDAARGAFGGSVLADAD